VLKLWGPTPWSSGFPSGETLRACRVTHDWTEGTGKSGTPIQDGATWNEYNYVDDLTTATNNWGTPGGDYTLQDSSTVVIPSYPVTWSSLNLTVTNIVKGWTTGAYQNFGFLVKLESESGGYKGGVFDSREYGQEYGNYSVLKLEITYSGTAAPTPTPEQTTEGSGFSPEILYAAAAVVVITALASVALFLAKKQKKSKKAP